MEVLEPGRQCATPGSRQAADQGYLTRTPFPHHIASSTPAAATAEGKRESLEISRCEGIFWVLLTRWGIGYHGRYRSGVPVPPLPATVSRFLGHRFLEVPKAI